MSADPNAWRIAAVREVVSESHRAATIRFAVDGWPGHRAGQRIDIRLTAEDGYSATRAYSLASAPGGPTVDVTVEELDDGEVSPYLVREVQPGDELEIRGPVGGAFTWGPSDGGPLLVIGGGSGLVPLMAMVRAHAHAGSGEVGADVRVLVSARTAADLLFLAELDALAAAGTIAFHPTLTREPAPPPGWAGSTRRVDAAMLRELGPDPAAEPQVFVCGPTGFVEAVARTLLAAGHAPEAIRTERFGPSS